MSDTIRKVRLKNRNGEILHPEVESYEIPIASVETLGGIKVGDNLSIDEDGKLNASASITVDSELSDSSENPVQNKVINAKLNEVFQSGSNGKNSLETAITAKGGTVSKADDIATFEELKTGIEGIQVGDLKCQLYIQEEEPTDKNGLWIKTSENPSLQKVNSIEDILGKKFLINTPIGESFSSKEIGNCIYMFGGEYTSTSAYKYDALTSAITTISTIPFGHYKGTISTNGTDTIYLLGSDRDYLAAYSYNIITDTYTKLPDAPTYFSGGSAIYVDNIIYIFGQYSGRIYKYNIDESTYTAISNYSGSTYRPGLLNIGKKIYMFGMGYDGSTSTTNSLKSIYEYDIDSDTYTNHNNILSADFKCPSATKINDTVYVLSMGSLYTYDLENMKAEKVFDISCGWTNTLHNINNTLYLITSNAINKYGILVSNTDLVYNGSTKSANVFNSNIDTINKLDFDKITYIDNGGTEQEAEYYIGDGSKWNKQTN